MPNFQVMQVVTPGNARIVKEVIIVTEVKIVEELKTVKEVKIVKEVEIVKEVKIVKEVIFDFSPPQSKALLLLNLFNWYEYFRFKRILIKHYVLI